MCKLARFLESASRQGPVKFQLMVHLLDNGGADPGQLRRPWRPVVTDHQISHLSVNLQTAQAAPTGSSRSSTGAVLTGSATEPHGHGEIPWMKAKGKDGSENGRTQHTNFRFHYQLLKRSIRLRVATDGPWHSCVPRSTTSAARAVAAWSPLPDGRCRCSSAD